jgi:hypothetical protein
MGLLTPIIASTSVGGLIALLIILGLLFLNYWATMRIITQAGYSARWIALPLAPLVFTIICYIIFWNDVRGIFFGGGFGLGFGNINNIKWFWRLDELSIFLNWLFYIIFAFSRWPVSGTWRSHEPEGPRVPSPLRANLGSAAGPVAPPASAPVARAMPVSPGGPSVGAARTPAATRPSAQCCAWCGESLPGNRALFHDCGPKDRPETHCKNCGTAFAAGTTQCNSCGAA